ncbi:transposase remnant [Ralstonia solanacearum UW551]|uniref:Transposase remnant n=1 Tax=Ralstonia solanacearum (strain UW551) TaxID=342110 RepID=A0AB33VDJ4_RALSU|nr:hypothetical protein CCY86_23310 [Ralstonia solanacearum]EAP72902.1 transposase remnant [Ralstonia solanacearum UW551]OYQ01829.1 hypothetical protein B7R79_16480 [Ralstonia solanacearum]
MSLSHPPMAIPRRPKVKTATLTVRLDPKIKAAAEAAAEGEFTQYCSGLFQDALQAYGMRSSMSRRGDCWDNAPTESLWGSLKVGRLHGRQFATRRAAMDEVVAWLGFYNARRLHSTLNYVSPMTFEKNWAATQQGKAA